MLRRKIFLATVAAAVSACTKSEPDLPFEGTWNNSRSGTEGIWLFISKSAMNTYLVREAVGRPDNFGRSATAKVMNGRLVCDHDEYFKELAFLDTSYKTLVTVNSTVREIQFYRQS